MMVIERILDDIARSLKLDPLAVRQCNLYGIGTRNRTPYGQLVEDNILPTLIDQLAASSAYAQRRQALAAWNAASPIIKRGLALTPVKFGISFTAIAYNQAGALVHVYSDGSVLVSHGGTEMGQGLHTKVRQIVAAEFGLPVEAVRIRPPTPATCRTPRRPPPPRAPISTARRRRPQHARSASA